MSETPEQLHARAAEALRMPPIETWDTFPFDGELRVRPLLPPAASEQQLEGEGGTDCWACLADDEAHIWTNERWRLRALEPSGLPLVLILEPRAHVAAPGDLDDELAAECGVLLARIERAVRSIGDVGRVHIGRWGEGSEHLHWWFMARPARTLQLASSFAAIWDDVLPPTPEDVWRANVAAVVAALERS
jgi:diadenosine tetraphosphate (Ap4A) HIT family hydrolase